MGLRFFLVWNTIGKRSYSAKKIYYAFNKLEITDISLVVANIDNHFHVLAKVHSTESHKHVHIDSRIMERI